MTDQTEGGIICEVEIRVTDSQNKTVSKHFEYSGGSNVDDAANRLRGGFVGSIDQKIKPVGDQD